MFVGHFAIAFLLWSLFPQIPLPVLLIAVSFPDLLWSVLVPAGVEKVKINPDSPLQKFVVFEKFPYSHSLVLGSVLSLPIGLLIAAVLNNPLVVPLFVAGSASHWLLDTVVHLKDLPVLGFDGDRKIGAGLWRRGPLAFVSRIRLLCNRHSVCIIRTPVSVRAYHGSGISCYQSPIVLRVQPKEQHQILQRLRSP